LLTEFQSIYDRLDINLIERGESFYQKHMEELVQDLERKQLLEEDEGRKIMWGENKNGIPLTVVKRDGGFTYDTSDLAALQHRIMEEGAEWVCNKLILLILI
jgi:arginyl-tRNA synthetase